MSKTKQQIIQEIISKIRSNDRRLITGDMLQGVLLDMFDYSVDIDVFLTQAEYDTLVDRGAIDPEKIYHIYEE